MKWHLLCLALVVMLVTLFAAPTVASGGDAGPPAAASSSPAPRSNLAPAAAPACDLSCQLEEAHRAVDRIKSAATPALKHVALATALILLARWLVMAAEFLLAFTPRAKRWIPLVLSAAGVVTAVATHAATGAGWAVSILYGLVPAGAVLLNEVLKLWKPAPATTTT